MAKLDLPNMLNYTRSIIPSNGVFFYVEDGAEKPVTVTQQTVRGTIANYGNVYKKDKQDDKEIAKQLDPENANIQRVDICYLPNHIERFHLRFSVTFAPHSLASGACNHPAYADLLVKFAETYKAHSGYETLAERYLQNLINGRWMWRNRYAADKEVVITISGAKEVAYTFKVQANYEHDYSKDTGFAELKTGIMNALSGDEAVFRINITGSGVLGMGQEVYPSQEFVEAHHNSKVSKVLCSIPPTGEMRQAAMHSQKIGNAIRTIDDWYIDENRDYGKIAVEPYGVVPSRSEAVRLPNTGSDLYTYLKNLEHWTESLSSGKSIPDEVHYVMACLIRGGVYSGEKKK